MNENFSRNLSIGAAVVSGLVLLGITNGFGITVSTNLFNTGIQASIVLGISSLVLAWALYMKYV